MNTNPAQHSPIGQQYPTNEGSSRIQVQRRLHQHHHRPEDEAGTSTAVVRHQFRHDSNAKAVKEELMRLLPADGKDIDQKTKIKLAAMHSEICEGLDGLSEKMKSNLHRLLQDNDDSPDAQRSRKAAIHVVMKNTASLVEDLVEKQRKEVEPELGNIDAPKKFDDWKTYISGVYVLAFVGASLLSLTAQNESKVRVPADANLFETLQTLAGFFMLHYLLDKPMQLETAMRLKIIGTLNAWLFSAVAGQRPDLLGLEEGASYIFPKVLALGYLMSAMVDLQKNFIAQYLGSTPNRWLSRGEIPLADIRPDHYFTSADYAMDMFMRSMRNANPLNIITNSSRTLNSSGSRAGGAYEPLLEEGAIELEEASQNRPHNRNAVQAQLMQLLPIDEDPIDTDTQEALATMHEDICEVLEQCTTNMSIKFHEVLDDKDVEKKKKEIYDILFTAASAIEGHIGNKEEEIKKLLGKGKSETGQFNDVKTWMSAGYVVSLLAANVWALVVQNQPRAQIPLLSGFFGTGQTMVGEFLQHYLRDKPVKLETSMRLRTMGMTSKAAWSTAIDWFPGFFGFQEGAGHRNEKEVFWGFMMSSSTDLMKNLMAQLFEGTPNRWFSRSEIPLDRTTPENYLTGTDFMGDMASRMNVNPANINPARILGAMRVGWDSLGADPERAQQRALEEEAQALMLTERAEREV